MIGKLEETTFQVVGSTQPLKFIANCTPNVSCGENDRRGASKKCVFDQKKGIGSHHQIPCNNAFLQLLSILMVVQPAYLQKYSPRFLIHTLYHRKCLLNNVEIIVKIKSISPFSGGFIYYIYFSVQLPTQYLILFYITKSNFQNGRRG